MQNIQKKFAETERQSNEARSAGKAGHNRQAALQDPSAYEAIDYQAVLDQIASNASFSHSVQTIKNAVPLQDLHEINRLLDLAKEAAAFEQAGSYVSLGGLADIRKSVKTAAKGMTLLPAELMEIGSFLTACLSVSKAFDKEKYPQLSDLASTLDPCRQLEREISTCIDFSGNVKEDATPALLSLSSKLLEARAELAAAGKRFVKSHSDQLMETMTTTIGGRLCVLVKAAYKNQLGGLVHGTSQSGQAYYMESSVLVDRNNEVQSLQLEIEEEKKAICRRLSQQVKSHSSALLSNEESLLVIDVALAKGKWCIRHDGCIPLIQTRDHGLRIEHALHPLLDMKTGVANTYELKPEQACLMISGSNMGGKTVTLKTIGLFSALAHAGFPVSAHSAVLPFYKQMFFDIGDSQSIENNLSTFSGHISALSSIVSMADKDTFILLDEIGNGTDPAEGAALAQAILESLMDKRATIITTTHYNSVKAFGKADPRVLVSSVEFDPHTLKPTYRYLPGVSGASYAFHIARQFGLEDGVIERAGALKKENESEVSRQLERLEKQQQIVQKEKDCFSKLIQEAHALQRKAAEDQQTWETRKNRLDQEYEQQLSDMLFEKKEEAKAILREIREQTKKQSHEQIEQMAKLDKLNLPKDSSEEEIRQAETTFKPGDYVRIESLNNHGEVQSVSKNKAQVLVNGRRVSVPISGLQLMKRPKAEKTIRKPHKDRVFKAFPMELNLIGMRVEAGIQQLDHYLDQAVYHNVKNVRIIHGMGTGRLRNAVWDDLRKHPAVKTFTAGGPADGGLGATLVELK